MDPAGPAGGRSFRKARPSGNLPLTTSATDRPSRLFLVWMHSERVPGWSMPASAVARLRRRLGTGWELRTLPIDVDAGGDGPEGAPRELLEAIREAEVYCGFGLPRAAFRAARRLCWVHSGAAGVSGSLYPEMRESDVVFTNSAGVYAEPMAEHAAAMILYFARGLDVAVEGTARREWRKAALAGGGGPVRELGGRTVAVVGYGATGAAVGRRASALGMRVLAIRRNPGDPPPEVAAVHGPDELTAVLSEADYVVLCVPETAETKGLIGPGELAAMGPEAVLINLSRGGIVDETSLVEALAEGRLRGAGLDVFQEEPLSPESPLWGCENVLITPHVSGVSPRFWEREMKLLLTNVDRYLAAEPLVNRVDKEAGY